MKRVVSNVSIPKPCTENWNNMSPDAEGKFCSNCQKTVTDFSGMSTTQIISILSTADKVCGRFRDSQLLAINRELSYKQSSFSWKKFSLAAAFVGFLPFIKADAQVKVNSEQYTQPQKRTIANNGGELLRVINGKVVDSVTKQPIVGAYIKVEGSDNRTTTDSAGCFTIELLSNEAVLFCTYVGHESKETKITESQSFYNIEIAAYGLPSIPQETESISMGAVFVPDLLPPAFDNEDTTSLILQLFK